MNSTSRRGATDGRRGSAIAQRPLGSVLTRLVQYDTVLCSLFDIRARSHRGIPHCGSCNRRKRGVVLLPNDSTEPQPLQGNPTRKGMRRDGYAPLPLRPGANARRPRHTLEPCSGIRHSDRIGFRRVLSPFFTSPTDPCIRNRSCD